MTHGQLLQLAADIDRLVGQDNLGGRYDQCTRDFRNYTVGFDEDGQRVYRCPDGSHVSSWVRALEQWRMAARMAA
jgi:hypothetical protein